MELPEQIAILLLTLQVVITIFLWSINAVGRPGAETFSLFLAIDLLAFAMLSNLYRNDRLSKPLRTPPFIVASIVVVLLLLASLTVG
jgi:hypothetical protein